MGTWGRWTFLVNWGMALPLCGACLSIAPKGQWAKKDLQATTNSTAVVFKASKALPMIDKWLERGTCPAPSHDEPF